MYWALVPGAGELQQQSLAGGYSQDRKTSKHTSQCIFIDGMGANETPQDALSKYSWENWFRPTRVEGQPQLVTFCSWESTGSLWKSSQKEAELSGCSASGPDLKGNRKQKQSCSTALTLSGPGDSQELQPVGWLCPPSHPFPGSQGKRSLLFAGWFVNTPLFPSRMKSKKCVCLLF